ncbi:MAG: MFS transporter [Phenylobacterium sp.]|uniref:MFS transporter n=1 Tax=Phenylobacterium sp. TaxID=1871053 RepID=UPI0025D246B4|nr:MFS transporter [Phenylobacterium sp.]MBI1199000.1 MFS transporter [Phenylobacterium sp.]
MTAPAAPVKPPGPASPAFVLGALAVMALSVASHANVTLKPLLISTYVTFLGVGRSGAGYIVGAEATATALAIVTVVSLLHRLGRRRTLFVAAFLIVLGNLLSMLAHTPYEIAAARAVAGVGHGAAQAVCAAVIAGFVSAERVSALVSVTVALAGMGLMFAVPAAQGAVGAWPLFASMAGLMALPLAMLRWIPGAGAAAPARTAAAARIARPGLVALSLGAAFFFYLSVGSFWPYATEFGMQSGLAYPAASAAAALAYLAAVVGSTGVMVLGHRIPKSFGVGGAILGAMASLGLLQGGGGTQAVFMAACVGFMFCWGVFYPLFMGFLSELDRSGRANGYFFTLAMASFALGPTLGGAVIDLAGGAHGDLSNLLWMSLVCQLPALGIVYAMSAFRRGGGAGEIPAAA